MGSSLLSMFGIFFQFVCDFPFQLIHSFQSNCSRTATPLKTMAMKLAFAFVSVAGAEVMLAKCGPNTKVTAGDEITVVDGQCTAVGSKEVSSVKFCGPGELTLSRMTCNNHDYKAITIKHDKTAYTTQCEDISAAGTNVEGWLGSLTVKC